MDLSSANQSSIIGKKKFFWAYLLILFIGIVLRLYHLDFRPLHHDEALHGVYSLYYLFNPKINYYKYDPLLHGPFLYHILPWFFWLMDISKWTLRLPAVLVGSLMILTPVLFNQFLKRSTQLLFAIFIALGPTFIYWSRYMRHDSFVFLTIMIFFLSLKTRGLIRAVLMGLAFGIHFATKENFFLHIAFIITIMLYEFGLFTILKVHASTLLDELFDFIRKHPIHFLMGILTFGLVAAFYYSAGFIYNQGILDGLYRKSLSYWMNQHNTERIPGPFTFAFLVNSLYESWWLPFIAIHLFFFYSNKRKLLLLFFTLSFIPGFIFTYTSLKVTDYSFLTNILKIKIHQDLFLFFPLIYHSIVGTTSYLLENKRPQAYSFFIFTATLFTYSFVGEKVPWLALYPLYSGVIFFALDFESNLNPKLIVLLFLFIPKLIYNTVWLNYNHASDSQNLLSQVHTTKEFEVTLQSIRKQMDNVPNGRGPLFLSKDGNTWPTSWYFFNRPEYKFKYTKNQLPHFNYILTTTDDSEASKILKDTHFYEDISYRSWFLPDYEKFTISDFIHYWWDFSTDIAIGGAKLRIYQKVNSINP